MALWGTLDQADNAPKYTTSAENGDKGADDFGTTVFGVSTVEATVAGDVTPGWVKRVVGTGGRTGRVTQETLVAMSNKGGISTDAEDVVYPNV
jgi:hypothetical protein